MNQLGELSIKIKDWFFEFNLIIGGVVFSIVMAAFLYNMMRSIRQWSFNNNQPLESVTAVVKSKRTKVVGRSNDTTRTEYYLTFEKKNGDRMEFEVKPEEYGQLLESDQGQLSYQGTRYLGFERKKQTGST